MKAKQPWEFPHVTLCRDHGKCDRFFGQGSNLMQSSMGGGFKHFLFSSLVGEDSHFD